MRVILITGLPMNAIFHFHCAEMLTSCQRFLGMHQQLMRKLKKQSMHLPKSALTLRCGKRFALAMLPLHVLAHTYSVRLRSGAMAQNLFNHLCFMRRCNRSQVSAAQCSAPPLHQRARIETQPKILRSQRSGHKIHSETSGQLLIAPWHLLNQLRR